MTELGDWALGIDVPFVVISPDGHKLGIYLSENVAQDEATKVGGSYDWATQAQCAAFYGVGGPWWIV